MLDLLIDPSLPALLSEAFLREARKAGVAMSDIELMSYDKAVVQDFLTAVRAGRTSAFLLTLDREHLGHAQTRALRTFRAEAARNVPVRQ